MLINNPDALKGWLVVVLEPLCDADSSALARYVLALLKKDKPERELKLVMIEQLDVFLGEETAPFVERLFNAIRSDEYVTVPLSFPSEGAVITKATVKENIKIESNSIPSDDLKFHETKSSEISVDKVQLLSTDDPKTKAIDTNSSSIKANDTIQHGKIEQTQTSTYAVNNLYSVSPPIRAIADKENLPRESRRRRTSLRSRSRSCSLERISRRSRSRDRRANDREKMQRQFRNKSPPLESRHIGHDRRRGGNIERRRIAMTSDDRSPRFSGSFGDCGRKGRPICSNSRSPSPALERGRGKGSPNNLRTIRSTPERLHNLHHEGEQRQRCRDFDEKGYCVRGETCPWDHGINPVVFEGLNKTALMSMSLREYNPDVPDLWTRTGSSGTPNALVGSVPTAGMAGNVTAGINPFTGAVRPGGPMIGIGYPHIGSSSVNKVSNGANTIVADYARSAGTGAFRPTAPMIAFPFNPASVTTPCQRELIPIPVIDANPSAGGDVSSLHTSGKRRFELEDSVAVADGPTKRKVSVNSRLGSRLPTNNCSLELRKIPRGLNTITHLNNHFTKFGKIINIQISYEGDPEAAIVTFSAHAEANVAYRSTEAVLNNRFIKVFWHSQESGSSNSGESTTMQLPGSRKNSQYHINNVPVVPTPSADSAKTSNSALASQSTTPTEPVVSNANTTGVEAKSNNSITTATHAPPTSLRHQGTGARGLPQTASTAIIRKKQEEQAKAVVQLAHGLRKRKQELLQSYVKQMKSALELVERCELNDPQRVKTLATIKVLQATIDKLRKEIAAEQEQMQAQIHNQQPPLPKKTKEQQKKELLDIELELFAQQQEGNTTNTTAIQKRLEELQRSLGIVLGNNALTGVTGQVAASGIKMSHFNRQNPLARTTYSEGSTRVDRRPKTIVVAGFTSEEADYVLGHFKHFGEITKHDVDKNIPQLILSYKCRINAEQAVLRGKIFKDKRLQVSWAPIVSPTIAATFTENKSTPLDGLSNEDNNMPANIIAKASEISLCETDAITTEHTLPELRLEDEEEDEECEDRSWRR